MVNRETEAFSLWKRNGARDRRQGYSRVAAPSDHANRTAWLEGWREQDDQINATETQTEAEAERLCRNCEWWDEKLKQPAQGFWENRAPCRGVTPSIGVRYATHSGETCHSVHEAIWPWPLETEFCPAFQRRRERPKPEPGLTEGDGV